MTKENVKKAVSKTCRDLRTNILNMTLQDVSKMSGYSQQLLSCFERGKSTNYVILFNAYYHICKNDNVKKLFIEKLFINMKE